MPVIIIERSHRVCMTKISVQFLYLLEILKFHTAFALKTLEDPIRGL